MNKVFIALVVAVLLAPVVIYAFVSVPLGGKIITTKPCDEGLLITLKTSRGVIPYIWFWGNLPYNSRISPHPGQNILGRAKTLIVPCTVSGVPYSGGLPILFHGSSYK